MEDISRELERELKAEFKPVPHKKTRHKKVIIIDDFGEIRSGGWLRTSNRFLLVLSIIFLCSSAVFYYLYSDLKTKNIKYLEKMTTGEKKIDFLTAEKEILMAKLVILGEKPEQIIPEQTIPDKKQSETIQKKDSSSSQIKEPETEENIEKISEIEPEAEIAVEDAIIPESQATEESGSESSGSAVSETSDKDKKTISIENFHVSRDRQNGDLLVRFDIRNISEASGDVSGYIFTVLRSENPDANDWLVVPTTTLENGIPQIHKKGQYFSISRFKPVKFRIKKQSSPEVLTKASIFVFNNAGDMIFNSVIDITEDGQA